MGALVTVLVSDVVDGDGGAVRCDVGVRALDNAALGVSSLVHGTAFLLSLDSILSLVTEKSSPILVSLHSTSKTWRG